MIFLSYRRSESETVARELARRLRRLHGESEVFLDETSIRTAEPWLERIKTAVRSASVVLVLMGQEWFTVKGDDGASRILDPDDVVRLEVGSAIQHGIPVVQLYLRGFEYPKDQDAYPEELRRLPDGQGLRFSLESDFDELIKRLIAEHKIYPRMAAWRKLWRVDFDRNLNFRGREELLETMNKAFLGGTDRHSRTRVIHGLGGVGKSQVALQYAHRYSYEYDYVWWMNAEDRAGLSGDYVKAARSLETIGELKLPGSGPEYEPEIVNAMRDWLDANDRWLVIMDNASGQRDLRGFIPSSSSSSGHLLITSRNPDWDYPCHHLGVMSEEAAVDLLLSMTESDDREGAAALARELGYLPLALAHAAAYMSRRGMEMTFGEYLERFRQKGLDVQDKLNLPRGPEATLSTTWEMALERIGDQSPAGLQLMDLCSYLAPTEIREEFIREAPDALPEGPLRKAVSDACLWDDCVDAPRSYSMIDKTKGLISLHRLVQMAVKRRLNEEERKVWARTAVALVERIFRQSPAGMVRREYLDALQVHAKTAVREANELGVDPVLTVEVQQRVGRMFAERAKWNDAKEMLRAALELCETKLEGNKSTSASVRAALGRMEYLEGQHTRAEASFRRALGDLSGRSIQSESGVLGLCSVPGGERTWDLELMAAVLTDYGKLLRESGRHEPSRELLTHALALRRERLGSDAPETIDSLNGLAELNYKMSRNEEALEQLQEVLDHRLRRAGPRERADAEGPERRPEAAYDIAIAAARDNLGLALDRVGRSEEAEEQHLKALEIRERELGPDHPKTAQTKHNLAVIYRVRPERRADAKRLLNEAIEAIGAVNRGHPDLLQALKTLAWTHVMAAEVDEARAVWKRREAVQKQMLADALETYDRASESDREAVSDALSRTIRLYTSQIRIEEAIEVYNELVRSRPDATKLVAPLASYLLSAAPSHMTSDGWYEHALAGDPDNGRLLNERGMFRKNVLHDYEGAEQCYNRALEVQPNQPTYLNNLAVLIASTATTEEARARARRIYERSLELEPRDVMTRGNYAFFLDQRLGETEEARLQYS
ncbi:MAG: tetratricopeptide repeat protein, partial [Candidatus Eisenbacteria bacterium]